VKVSTLQGIALGLVVVFVMWMLRGPSPTLPIAFELTFGVDPEQASEAELRDAIVRRLPVGTSVDRLDQLCRLHDLRCRHDGKQVDFEIAWRQSRVRTRIAIEFPLDDHDRIAAVRVHQLGFWMSCSTDPGI
jgi:hypothetical protein